jgi:hypothetical protein
MDKSEDEQDYASLTCYGIYIYGAVWLLAREHMFYFCFYILMNGWFRSIGKQGNWVSGSFHLHVLVKRDGIQDIQESIGLRHCLVFNGIWYDEMGCVWGWYI